MTGTVVLDTGTIAMLSIDLSKVDVRFVVAWAFFVAVGAVFAFAVFAILKGRREDKEYKETTLPGADMVERLKEKAVEDSDSLESLDVSDLKNAGSTGGLPAPALPMPNMGGLPDPSYGAVNESYGMPAPMSGSDDDGLGMPGFDDYRQPAPAPAPTAHRPLRRPSPSHGAGSQSNPFMR